MRKLLVFAAFAAMAITVAACTGDDDDDDDVATSPTSSPSPSPSPSPTSANRTATVQIQDWPHTNNTFIRIIAGTNAAASSVHCRAMGAGTATMTFTSAGLLQVGMFYSAEIWSDLNNDGNFDPAVGNAADHDYRSATQVISSASPGTVTFLIDHDITAGPGSFTDTTWTAASTGCPGD